MLYLLTLRKFIPPKIKRIPPAKIIHLFISEENPVNLGINVIPKLRKYIPKSKYNMKKIIPPPLLTMVKIEKKYI